MGLGMWLKDDLENVLAGLSASATAMARWADGSDIAAYRQGYLDALGAVAVALGVQARVIESARLEGQPRRP